MATPTRRQAARFAASAVTIFLALAAPATAESPDSRLLGAPPWNAEGGGRELRLGDMILEVAGNGLDERLSGEDVLAIALKDPRPWPGGRLPVVFDPAIPEPRRRLFFDACEAWSAVASVRCLPRTREFSFLYVVPGEGCSSKVGSGLFAWTAARKMTLGEGCWSGSILMHELGHAFGLTHEHQRADRDRYIRVLWENLEPEHRYSYAVLRFAIEDSPYDFASIMHYDTGTFSKAAGLSTFVGRPGFEAEASSAGRAWKPSAGDAEAMRRRYGKPK